MHRLQDVVPSSLTPQDCAPTAGRALRCNNTLGAALSATAATEMLAIFGRPRRL